jgi:hypothetical protein
MVPESRSVEQRADVLVQRSGEVRTSQCSEQCSETALQPPGVIAAESVQEDPAAVNHPNVWLHQGADVLETGVSRLEGMPQP